MAKEQNLVMEGDVLESLSNARFRIRLDNGAEINGSISGKMRMHYIKIIPGDRVEVELSVYDLTNGRITKRLKGANQIDYVPPKRRRK